MRCKGRLGCLLTICYSIFRYSCSFTNTFVSLITMILGNAGFFRVRCVRISEFPMVLANIMKWFAREPSSASDKMPRVFYVDPFNKKRFILLLFTNIFIFDRQIFMWWMYVKFYLNKVRNYGWSIYVTDVCKILFK